VAMIWNDRLAEVWAEPGKAGAGVVIGAAAVLTARCPAASRRCASWCMSRGAGKNHAMNTASVSTLLNTARRTG